MVNAIPNIVRKTWDDWNVRGVILISLGFQIFLILFSPLRKRTNITIVTFSLWSAYLLADYSANFCIGLIFDKRGNISTTSVNNYIVVFWVPFLLLHLGGPDTITAFSLEDNELWLRHLLSFVFQLVTTVYLFLLTIPGNTLWLPTVLVFFAGIIKYIERTRSLYLASMDTFRKSVAALSLLEHDQQPEAAGPNRYNSTGGTDYVELVRKGYEYFEKFKGLIVDMTYSLVERNESRRYFLSRTPEDALTVIEVELNFIYEYFFTKASVLRTKVGYVCRFAGFSSILAALLIFILDKKHGFSKFDVRVTYILLLGAVSLEFVALFKLIFSDRTAVGGNVLIEHFIRLKKPKWTKCQKKPYTKFEALSTNPLFRRWSGAIPGLDATAPVAEIKQKMMNRNMILERVMIITDCFGAKRLVEKWKYKANNPFIKELWEFVFSELQRKSGVAEDAERVKIICEARGGWSIQSGELEVQEKGKLMPFIYSNEVASFDETLLVWCSATNACFNVDARSDQNVDPNAINDHQYFSKLLADYMLYLCAMEPAIMSSVAGIGPQRISVLSAYQVKPLDEVKKVMLHDSSSFEDAAIKVYEKFLSRLFPKLLDAGELAKELMALEKNKRWKIVAQVWVEMLSYAAINCRPDALVQQLRKGGQLITFVWLLMLHLGLGSRQFKSHAGIEGQR